MREVVTYDRRNDESVDLSLLQAFDRLLTFRQPVPSFATKAVLQLKCRRRDFWAHICGKECEHGRSVLADGDGDSLQ